jgi:23S rRNA pseudouridine2605 synthase
MRLNVYLQRAGIGSRREAERLIMEGRVTVNDIKATVTTPAEDGDVIKVNGKSVSVEEKDLPRLFMLNKPLDVLVTNKDPQGRPTVFELPALTPPLWKPTMPRVMNVGRLDVNSEGLLLFSSDGPLAQAMMSPTIALERTYRVRVLGRLRPDQLQKLADGVTIDGIRYRGADITEEKEPSGRNTWYKVVITEGKNREVRKLMEHFGCVVGRLVRTQYGPFHLGELGSGQIREINRHDVKKLIADLRGRGAKLA